ncbi:FAD-dependent oxidoreductase, partial [Desulfovibrio sp. OttesenSCG-928-A18]|nr:FAD-dependent oxidoreductase [Desulfovibrio sp. OttesenSCG-928-A18]
MSNSEYTYDVVIVGGGPAGLFAAYWLAGHGGLSVCLLEKGERVSRRRCPMGLKDACMHCKPCHILSGMGGAGLFSDGKLNFIHKLGKTDLTQFLPLSEAQELIRQTEEIFSRFGMDGPVFPTDMDAAYEIRRKAKKAGIDLLLIRQKHLGSDFLPGHIDRMCVWLEEKGVHIRTGQEV